ncbi:MAG: hypothetical protein RBT69_13715 [Spirochaetia bacterium]|jgi:hypothetical protein|nr:hypothetical protein [Spirochaetia bacterium]
MKADNNDGIKKKSPASKEILERESVTFRINRDLWTDFDYWCKKNRISRSDILEKFILEKIGRNPDDYNGN